MGDLTGHVRSFGHRSVGAVLAQHVAVDRYAEIDHRPAPAEIDDAVAAARDVGLRRLDERVLPW